ncbi:MAG TPA: membrane protein insertase YidC [Methylophilus sp.]|nr:membrane protein insertase YidC [Methylophilus sp.]HQQ32326.1 membrane protein insertase YidC [Methylophilus sp.]
MDTRRLILFVIFSFSTMLLWNAWMSKETLPNKTAAQTPSNAGTLPSAPSTSASGTDALDHGKFKLESAQRILINTDLYQAEIDTAGGDLRRLVLNKHRASESADSNFVLMDDAEKPMLYIAQTGLLGADLPNHKTIFTSASQSYQLTDGSDSLEVRLSWSGNGVSVDKVYTFHRNQYLIDVRYEITNGGSTAISPSVYYQLLHDNQSNQGSKMMPTFTGGAYFTNEKKFNKINFADMAKQDFSLTSPDGWAGIIQHYFAGAWIVKEGINREFYTKKLSNQVFSVGVVTKVSDIAAGSKAVVDAKLFAGPQTERDLVAAAPGLEYAVDYGWLTVIAKPLFWLLSKIHSFVGNWGVAIILLTVLIKAAFFRLSASSYRSMAQMRELAPRLQAMKEKFGDDRQKMQQAMLELYRTEKINPMGGCLPILVQIPVFIALYWVLLGSVELRHAPFFGWIKDLSATDPLYILPLLMGISMIIQTYLNPAPTDPIQAKMMKIMPVVFSIFFFFFPAGLVLYWLVNNILSIWQQWYINKIIHAETLAKKGSGKR